MKMAYDHGEIIKSSGSMETAQASIAMTPEMLQLLSSGVYEHKIRAVIRELSTNGCDGHVAAGNADEPLLIHLPNGLEPWFEVRDFGTGLSHEQVMGMYLTYGMSTKNDSNDYIGAMGIGSKSPFAYTDAFTVTSIQQGVERQYTVYKEAGIPQITKLTEKATKERDGFIVRVAVQREDYNKFAEEAKYVFETFTVKPKIVGNNAVAEYLSVDSEVLLKGNGYIIKKAKSAYGRGTRFFALMGQIRYPLDTATLKMPQLVNVLSSQTEVYLTFDLGEVAIAASRESLSMDKNTLVKVQEVIDRIDNDFLHKAQEKISSCENIKEAYVAFGSIFGFRGRYGPDRLHQFGMKRITFDGKTMEEHYNHYCRSLRRDAIGEDGRVLYEEVIGSDGKPVLDRFGNKRKARVVISEGSFCVLKNQYGNKTAKQFQEQDLREYSFMGNSEGKQPHIHFLMWDLKTRNKKIQEALCAIHKTMILVDDEEEMKKVIGWLVLDEGDYTLYKTSEHMDLYVAPAKGASTRGLVTVHNLCGSVTREEVDFSELDEVYYFQTYRGRSIDADGQERQPFDLRTIMRLKGIDKIYDVRKMHIKHLPDHAINVNTVEFEKELFKPVMWKYINYGIINEVGDVKVFHNNAVYKKVYAEDSPFDIKNKRYLRLYMGLTKYEQVPQYPCGKDEDGEDVYVHYRTLVGLAQRIGYLKQIARMRTKVKNKFNEAHKDVYDKYPLVQELYLREFSNEEMLRVWESLQPYLVAMNQQNKA